MAIMKDTPENRKRGEKALTSDAMKRNNEIEARNQQRVLNQKKTDKSNKREYEENDSSKEVLRCAGLTTENKHLKTDKMCGGYKVPQVPKLPPKMAGKRVTMKTLEETPETKNKPEVNSYVDDKS